MNKIIYVDINLKGVWLCMRSEIPQMLERGKGVIVNTSSFAGLTASKLGLVAYSGSKHGRRSPSGRNY